MKSNKVNWEEEEHKNKQNKFLNRDSRGFCFSLKEKAKPILY